MPPREELGDEQRHLDASGGGVSGPGTGPETFDDLVSRVESKEIASRGMILVSKDADGEVNVRDTGDHMGAGEPAGAVASVCWWVCSHHRCWHPWPSGGGRWRRRQVRRAQSPQRDRVQSLRGPEAGSGCTDRNLRRRPKAAGRTRTARCADEVGRGDRQVQHRGAQTGPGRGDGQVRAGPVLPLPIPDRAFGGTAGRTLRDSVADWSFIPGATAPEDAPNVLVILIDDAGFGSIDSFGGPVKTPTSPGPEHGAHLQPIPRDRGVLTDPRRTAHRPQPAPGRLWFDRRVPGPSPATAPPSPRVVLLFPASCATTAT